MSPVYHPWENKEILLDLFLPYREKHIYKRLGLYCIGTRILSPRYCLVDCEREVRQSSFQLHFVQILASWCQTKQARKINTHAKLDLVGGQSPDYLVFPKVENTFQGGISIAATICCPLVGKCLKIR